MGEIYKVEIGFKEQKNCLECPIKDDDDNCKLQTIGEKILQFDFWQDQELGCPLHFDRKVY